MKFNKNPEQLLKHKFYDFIVELTDDNSTSKSGEWTLYVNRASKTKGSGVGIVLDDARRVKIKQILKFDFLAPNNQVEYEALIGGFFLSAKDVGERMLVV